MPIVDTENLPERLKLAQKLSHNLARESFIETWNKAVKSLNEVHKELCGNDALAFFGTLIGDFTARWLHEMTKIANADDAGIPKDELVKQTLKAIAEFLEVKIEPSVENLPHGIKRLNQH
jgi:hypothetical protein